MTISDRLTSARNKITGKQPSDPAALRQRITGQHALVQSLEAEHAQASLEWASGASGSAAQLDALDAKLATGRRELRALQSALSLAQQQEAQAERERLAALHATQIRACEQHLAARDKAAEELSTAIGAAVAAYRQLVTRSDKAFKATPLGMSWPLGSPVHVGELRALVEKELYRQGGDPSLSGRLSFPGAQAHDLRVLNEPGKLEPLVDELKRWSAWTLAELKGKPLPQQAPAAPAAPAPTAPAEAWESNGDNPALAEEQETLRTGPKGVAGVPLPVVKMS